MKSIVNVVSEIRYGKRFYGILQSKDASSIAKLSPDVKAHVMKSLASLAKFQGRYDEWLDIVKRFQLKWSNQNKSFKTFQSIIESESRGNNLELMIKWVTDVSSILPLEYKNVLFFNTLTGLRLNEAQQAINLIKSKRK